MILKIKMLYKHIYTYEIIMGEGGEVGKTVGKTFKNQTEKERIKLKGKHSY